MTEGELVLIGGPGDGEVIAGVHTHGSNYFRFRTDDERERLGDHLGDTYVLHRHDDFLIGEWDGPEGGGARTTH